MAKRMFCGELNGELVTAHIDNRADSVRLGIAVMFSPGAPMLQGWREAKKEGWRVVPVIVQHANNPR